MRTTIDIEEDVLAAAKELAKRQRSSVGQVVSELLRKVLTGKGAEINNVTQSETLESQSVAGFRPFPAGRAIVTNETVNRLRESEGL